MLGLILSYHNLGQEALAKGAPLSKVANLPVRERIGRAKYIREDALSEFDAIEAELGDQMGSLTEGGR